MINNDIGNKCMRQSQQMLNIYHRYRNVTLYDGPRLKRVGTPHRTTHSQMQIAEGKTQTKKLTGRVAFQLHICALEFCTNSSPITII